MPKPIRAAGGVVWRQAQDHSNNSAVEIAVVHRPRYDDWTIPKGKLAAGESELEGGLREVFEETGYRVRPGRALGDVRYLKNSSGGTREKIVHYWAMQAVGGAFTPSREVDELVWVSPEGADKILSRDSDREILERFVAGPVQTSTVLMVRHGSAGERENWDADDRLRPLDEVGHDQSQELVRLLSRFEVEHLVSADNVRCLQTLKPLGDSIGAEILEEPLLSEEGFPGRETEAADVIRRLGDDGKAVAACSQREVIPPLVALLAGEDGLVLPQPFRSKKASVWALSFDGDRLVGAEYFPPPDV